MTISVILGGGEEKDSSQADADSIEVPTALAHILKTIHTPDRGAPSA